MTQEKDWDELWQHTEYYFGGKFSILINNAGVHAIHGWKACIDIMCYGVGLGANLAIERMATSKVLLLNRQKKDPQCLKTTPKKFRVT